MVRLKTRYVLFEILYPPSEVDAAAATDQTEYLRQTYQSSPQAINTKVLLRQVRASVEEYFGNYGSGVTSSNLVLKYFSNATSTGIVRCSRDHYQIVCAALSLIHRIEDRPCVVRVVKVSGTIKKAESYAVTRNRALMARMHKRASAHVAADFMGVDDDDNDNEL